MDRMWRVDEPRGYKWWKKQTPDMEQVRLEVVDIWHFGLSALFDAETDLEQLAEQIVADFTSAETTARESESAVAQIHEATEALAQHVLASKAFSVPLFAALMQACELSAEGLYRHYVGKTC